MNEPLSSIGAMQDGVYAVRGVPLPELIREGDFVSALWLTWTGSKPSPETRRLLDACLVACVDHGTEPPSAAVARIAASCGKPLADAVASGMLTLGPRHGNACGASARWVSHALAQDLSAQDVVVSFETENVRIPGVGHPVYETDPRTEELFRIARETLSNTAALDLITDVARIASERKQKTMPVNVDGALGAIVSALGVEPELADALFLLGRTVGMVAHAREEASQNPSYRRG
jgi:citryl-CoA lyase